MISAIVAVGKNWEIGKQNGLLFKLTEDMKFFKNATEHNFVVMGENTLLSFPGGKPLKNRVNIVLCPEGHEYEDCICFHDFEQLVRFVKILSTQYMIWVIGGGMMYRSMIPYYDSVFVNKVEAEDKEATVFFPNLDEDSSFKVSIVEKVKEDNGYSTQLVVYSRC